MELLGFCSSALSAREGGGNKERMGSSVLLFFNPPPDVLQYKQLGCSWLISRFKVRPTRDQTIGVM